MQFLMSVVFGAAVGVLYDCFRVLRIVFPAARKSVPVFVMDIIFMLCCGGLFFLFSVIFCRGNIRFYCILGALPGFVMYILTLGNLITKIIRAIVTTVYSALQKVYSSVFVPIVNIAKGIYQKFFHIFVHSYENKQKTQ